MPRLYSLTDAGRNAWNAQSAKVPLDSRRVLGLVKEHTDPEELCKKLGWSEVAVLEVLTDLERDRLVKSVDAGNSASELDFTGTFQVADIQAALKKK